MLRLISMPSKKEASVKEDSCYICGRSQSEVNQLVQKEIASIAQSSERYITDLKKVTENYEKEISQLESFLRKIKKDIAWETAMREPDAMMEFIPGLQEVWHALTSTEPDAKSNPSLSGHTKATISRLQKELVKTQELLAKLDSAPRLETMVPFVHFEVNLTIPSYELKESRDDVERVDKPLVLKVLLCPVCKSLTE
jgi:exopolysaccharide biosynthesis predicted pyruvyltransferase EpsI